MIRDLVSLVPIRLAPDNPYVDALKLKVRVIAALVLRETRAHYGESRLGYLWAFLEPIAHMMVISVLWIYILRRHIPVGDSFMLFFFSGLTPYFFYYKMASYLSGAVAANKALTNMPPVKPLDVMLARAILEAATEIAVAVILFSALALSGIEDAVPSDPLALIEVTCVLFGLGFGLGMINAVIGLFIHNWKFLSGLVLGPLYLLSGIFFDPLQMPPELRQYLAYNPILHCVEWFRSAFYIGYGDTFTDRGYPLYWMGALLVLGFGLERVMRRKMMEPL